MPGTEEWIALGDEWLSAAKLALLNATVACNHEGRQSGAGGRKSLATDLRNGSAGDGIVNPIAQALVDECKPRAGKTVEYTALGFTIWAAYPALAAHGVDGFCLSSSGALATWQIVTQYLPWLAAVLTLLATGRPSSRLPGLEDGTRRSPSSPSSPAPSRICATASGNLPRWGPPQRGGAL